jgi:hypothetical protein
LASFVERATLKIVDQSTSQINKIKRGAKCPFSAAKRKLYARLELFSF